MSTRMTEQADPNRADAFYDDFYKTGGWKYSFWKEYWWHRKNVVKAFGLRRGSLMVEVACGNGFHTNLFNRLGFRCIGVDRSSAGIEWAQRHNPRSTYHCRDIMDELPVPTGSLDVILARGCSHYHYDLGSAQAMDTTTHLIRYLKPGGVFIMAIVSDLSGRREPDKVWQNKLEDYERHFSSFDRRWSVNWVDGMAVCGLWNASVAESTSRPVDAALAANP